MMIVRSKYFALAILSAALLLSCVKEPQEPGVPEGPGDQEGRITSVVHYRATVGEGIRTKASMNNQNQYIFETGDQLYILDTQTSGTKLYGILNLVAGAGDPTGTFEGDLMCLNEFEPESSTGLSATLVSKDDKIHTCENGKITGTNYDNALFPYADSFPEAIRYFSNFTDESTFGTHAFSLQQQSAFLIFSVTFNDADATTINGASTVTAILSNNGTPIRTGTVSVAEIDFADQTRFVAALPASTDLQSATISFRTTGGTDISTDAITNASLQANRYYDISRSHVDLSCFTIQARETGTTTVTCKYTGDGIQYNLNGTGWVDYGGSGIELAQRGYVQFRGKRTSYQGEDQNDNPVFTADKACFIFGDIMSLICNNSYTPKTSVVSSAFRYAFKNCTWIDIPAGRPLRLSATTLNTYCYNQMFWGCTSLTRPPELQTTLTADVPQHAYSYMFKDCSSLVSAPDLPEGGTVGQNGYRSMFQGCTSLITVPATIAGTSGNNACYDMFNGCSSLVNAPALTSDTVGSSGYYQMFMGCTSLVQAPELNAVTLGTNAYKGMFSGCTSLTSAPPSLPAMILQSSCYESMFYNCQALSKVPTALPATASAASCYKSMFEGCISISRAPELYLTDIGSSSCSKMFYGCTSLVTAEGLERAGSVGSQGCFQMFSGCGELTTTPPQLKPETLSYRAYYQMYYNCAKITAAPDIKATAVDVYNGVSESCFQMFYGCRRLRTAPPRLNVATVKSKAFKGMFQGCVSLASAPEFPSMTTVELEGCMNMFNGCTNLKSAPELPATSLATSAYQGMFQNSGLTAVPTLPATTLAEKCYQSMFAGCKYLVGPAVLPAQELATSCYSNMFDGATIFDSVVCLATTNINTTNCNKWLRGVSASGTFVRPAGVDSWNTNAESGIPTGWTTQDSGLDPIFPDGGPFDPEVDL